MRKKENRNLWKKALSSGLSFAVAFASLPTVLAAAGEVPSESFQKAAQSRAAAEIPVMTKAGSISVSEDTLTYDEPFAQWTAGCQNFRIPALITLQDGSLLATADARWETAGDGGGIDSIASVSQDGGKTWHYSFPFYFPDSYGYAGNRATTIIDPGVLEGPDGTIYFIADVNPTGGTTMGGYRAPGIGTGYVNVDNRVDQGRYQALTENWDTSCNTIPADDNLTAYPYYIGDLNQEGFAKILKRSDGSETGYGVDEWYNLYSYEEGEFKDDLERSTVVNNSSMEIQQNAFYKDSCLHVFGNTDYLWVITSKDGGRSWEHPRDLTDQIKRNAEGQVKDRALLVSPGRGISTASGDLAIGFYDHGGDEENASIVYSTDNGKTWERTEDMQRTENSGFWTSENEVVELEDGTLRIFARNGKGKICYADAKKNEAGKYVMEDTSVVTEVSSTSTCNVTAISYSKKINGKQAILVACPTGGTRAKGKIFTFLVEEDNSMTLYNELSVPNSENGFVYSCLTEMEDGTVALLWEPNKWEEGISMYFETFSILDIAPGALLEDVTVKVNLMKGETYTRSYEDTAPFSYGKEADSAVAEVSSAKEGNTKTITISGADQGYTEAVIDNVTYSIRVEDPTIIMPEDSEGFVLNNIDAEPEYEQNNVFDISFELSEEWKMFDHSSNTSNSLDSFSGIENDRIDLSDAEFIFEGSGETYSIYSESKKTYLRNTGADSFFGTEKGDMKVVWADDGFRICQTNGSRYIIFYTNEMNFNTHSSYQSNYSDGTYEMMLLEKQDAVSDDDVLPGYRRAASVTSGKKYLISYLFDEEHVIVLYPQNGKANQTKLVKRPNVLKITPKGKGTASFTVNGRRYDIKVVKVCSHSQTVVKGRREKDCLEDGYTGDTYCADPECGALVSEGSVIPATGCHTWDEGHVVKEVSETSDGELLYTCLHNPAHKKTVTVYAYIFNPLKEEYDSASEIVENLHLYAEDGVTDLLEAYEKGMAIVEGQGSNSSSMIQVTEALKAALLAMTPKTKAELLQDLNGLIEKYQKDYQGTQDQLQAGVWNSFKDAYEQAQEVTADAELDVVGSRIKALQQAGEALNEEKRVIAKNALQQGISQAKADYAAGGSQYTADTWKKFKDAYDAAVKELETADASELAGLLNRLQTARSGLKKAEAKAAAKVGDTATIDGVTYRVTDLASKTAAVTGSANATVKILPDVTIKNEKFTVTRIAEKAFQNSKTLKKVFTGSNVTSIGAFAFSGCGRLSSVTIEEGVKSIEKKAFFKCGKLKTITIKSKNLTTIHKTAFKKTASKVTVKMPKGLQKKKKNNLLKKLQKAGISKKAKIK